MADQRTSHFLGLLSERDAEVGADNPYSSQVRAMDKLYQGDAVKLFDGGVARKIDTIDTFPADSDGMRVDSLDGWSRSSYADGETFVVEYAQHPAIDDNQWYFKITGYYDSWDNGQDDVFKVEELVEVTKAQVVKYEWSEV